MKTSKQEAVSRISLVPCEISTILSLQKKTQSYEFITDHVINVCLDSCVATCTHLYLHHTRPRIRPTNRKFFQLSGFPLDQ